MYNPDIVFKCSFEIIRIIQFICAFESHILKKEGCIHRLVRLLCKVRALVGKSWVPKSIWVDVTESSELPDFPRHSELEELIFLKGSSFSGPKHHKE